MCTPMGLVRTSTCLVCTPMRLVCTATRLSPASAYGRTLLLYAATPYTPSAWAASVVGVQQCKTRMLDDSLCTGDENPPRWQDQVGGVLSVAA
jgi:hypothetical protein